TQGVGMAARTRDHSLSPSRESSRASSTDLGVGDALDDARGDRPRTLPNRATSSTLCVSLPRAITSIDCGVDTLTLAYRGLNPDSLMAAFPAWPSTARRVLKDPSSGLTFVLGTDRAGRTLLSAEGRLSALLADDESDESLASPADLCTGERRAREVAARVGIV